MQTNAKISMESSLKELRAAYRNHILRLSEATRAGLALTAGLSAVELVHRTAATSPFVTNMMLAILAPALSTTGLSEVDWGVIDTNDKPKLVKAIAAAIVFNDLANEVLVDHEPDLDTY